MVSLDRALTQRLHRLDSQSSPLSAVEEPSPLVGLSKAKNPTTKGQPRHFHSEAEISDD